MVHFRLNVPAIQSRFRDAQREFRHINGQLNDYSDPLTDEVVGNMIAVYDRVDQAIAAGVDLFALGNSRQVLELNDLVLCRGDRSSGRCSPEHFKANERPFCDDSQGGIRDLVEWGGLRKNDSPWERAAGFYVRVLSETQLHIEGNFISRAITAPAP